MTRLRWTVLAAISLYLAGAEHARAQPLVMAEADSQPVSRWLHSGLGDWVSLSRREHAPAGYHRHARVQFRVLCAPAAGTVAVYRWYHDRDRDWISLADGEIADATLRAWGYRDKRLQFYALAPRGEGGR